MLRKTSSLLAGSDYTQRNLERPAPEVDFKIKDIPQEVLKMEEGRKEGRQAGSERIHELARSTHSILGMAGISLWFT